MDRPTIQGIVGFLRRQKLWKIIAAGAIVTVPFTVARAKDSSIAGSFEIQVASRIGFFKSPGYTLRIKGDGRVMYRGFENVHAMGERHDRIPRVAIEELVAHIRSSGFLDLPGSYDNRPCLARDSSEGAVRVRLDDREKSVGTCGAPPAVERLMDEVDSLARVWRWVVYDPRELRLDLAHGFKVSDHMPDLMDDAILWDADEIIRILVANGADPNGFDDSNAHFLMRAVWFEKLKAVRALLDVISCLRLKNC